MEKKYIEELQGLETIADAIDFAIEKSGITRAVLYKSADINQSNFRKMMELERKVDSEKIIKMAAVLKNTVITDWILVKAGVATVGNQKDLDLRLKEIEDRLDKAEAKDKEMEERITKSETRDDKDREIKNTLIKLLTQD